MAFVVAFCALLADAVAGGSKMSVATVLKEIRQMFKLEIEVAELQLQLIEKALARTKSAARRRSFLKDQRSWLQVLKKAQAHVAWCDAKGKPN